MKKIWIGLFTLFICIKLSTTILFAQTLAPKSTSTPTPQIHISPIATSTATISASIASPAATPVMLQSTVVPSAPHTVIPAENIQSAPPISTPTPQIVDPTVTPRALPLIHKGIDPPAKPVSKAMTAPPGLTTNTLPEQYYSNESLAPQLTVTLLLFAVMSITEGLLLLGWPNLTRRIHQLAYVKREKKTYQYLTGSI